MQQIKEYERAYFCAEMNFSRDEYKQREDTVNFENNSYGSDERREIYKGERDGVCMT